MNNVYKNINELVNKVAVQANSIDRLAVNKELNELKIQIDNIEQPDRNINFLLFNSRCERRN